jgi:hypothetical protein
MDRQATESLARFCIEQRNALDPDDWYQRSETDGKVVALAAKFLSMTSWYGHDDELVEIATKIHPALDGSSSLYCEAQAMAFDWPHFSTTVRIGIALQQVQRAAAPGGQCELFDERRRELRS